MARHPKYRALTELAHAAAKLVLPELITFAGPEARNYFLMPNGRTICGRIRIGSQSVTVIYTEETNQAARIVDAAWYHFFPWRTRGPLEPQPVQFNYSPEQAKHDCASAEIKTWLESLEKALTDHGLITPRSQLVERRHATPDGLKKKSTLDLTLAELKKFMETELATLHAKLDRIEKQGCVQPPIVVVDPSGPQWTPLTPMCKTDVAPTSPTRAQLDGLNTLFAAPPIKK
jgi:hypothetical protein